ncbi:SDR family oxidoreductase [Nonomuraea sp. NPDC050153]|uniref:SDR family oxidoreductase n=1 Tax=Nonomuraea sp. NPDC050153 TaxID=3364359 RepID=UPI0037A5808B
MTSGTSTKARIALVTGANRGIGRAITQQLAELGMTVYLGSRDLQRGQAAERELRGAGLDVHALQLDTTDEATVLLGAKRIEQESGRLDVLVNNAGIISEWRLPSQLSADQVRPIFETNVFGVITVTNAMLPLLRRSEAGRIVNLSSTLGSLAVGSGAPDPGGYLPPGFFPEYAAYSASKAALNALTIRYAHELRDTGILVNAACPGRVATDMNDGEGDRTPEQGALVAVRLATLPEGGRTGTFTGTVAGTVGNLTDVLVPW